MERVALFLFLTVSASQAAESPYLVPRTVDGHPDLQGVWATGFLTPLERPPTVEGLVATPEQAAAMAAEILGEITGPVDPDTYESGVSRLAMVRGQYRTSQIVSPDDGQLPYTQAARDLVEEIRHRFEHSFESAQDRPLMERCLDSLGAAPIRTVPAFLPRQIFQNRDVVAILAEDAMGLRLIHLEGEPPSFRSLDGYSKGRWEGDSLVVETTHLRAEYPVREDLGHSIVISPDTRVTERFTRVSDTELVYRYTVEDDALYTEPWVGEFSLTRHDTAIYEYACHEGNYSIPLILRGGQTAE